MDSRDVSGAPTYLNALGLREILLRNKNLIEFPLDDLKALDYVDLSHNRLTEISPSQTLPRLKGLMLAHNKICSVSKTIHENLPNLEVLVLSDNGLSSNEDLDFLSDLRKLTHLSIENNSLPPNSRLYAIHLQPALRFVNYERVTDAERAKAKQEFSSVPTLETLSKTELLARLEAAESLEEIAALEAALKE